MYDYGMSQIITSEFDLNVKRWQVKQPEAERIGLHMEFSLPIDHNKEEGYRNVELVIYGDMNYVGVYIRENWTVIPLEHLEYNEAEDETYVKKGHDYVKGEATWDCLVYHDSEWRSGVQEFLRKYRDKIGIIRTKGASGWYTKLRVTPELEAEFKRVRDIKYNRA